MDAHLKHVRLRTEITLLERTEGTPLVYHRTSNRYFQLPADAFKLLRLFNGQRSYTQVAEAYQATVSHELGAEDIRKIAETHYRKFLDFPAEMGVEQEDLESVTPSYLKLSRIILPSQTVSVLASRLKFLFIPTVCYAALCSFLLMLGFAFFTYWGQLQFYLENAPLFNIGLFLAIMILATLVHEFGHAAACEYYKVKHGGIGIGFYLLSPVMFADVTAAWRLPPGERIVINFAGMYFEVLLSIFLLILLFVLGNPVFLGFTMILLIHIVFNLNPFLRTDGYWILSDWLRVPNLRSYSSTLLRNILVTSRRKGFQRSEWLLVGYATFSYMFIGAFLYYILFKHEGSLLNFTGALVELAQAYYEGSPVTILTLFDTLQTILIPLLFYYLLIKIIILPAYRKLRKDYQFNLGKTAGAVPIVLLIGSATLTSCDQVKINWSDEDEQASEYTVQGQPPIEIAFQTITVLQTHDSLLKAGQPLFINFSADWCKPCKIMSKRTLRDPRVVDCISRNYTSLYVDIDTPAGKELKIRYGVKSIPTYLILPDSSRIIGMASADKMLNTCCS